MCLSLILAATTFCNPMSIPDTPIGVLCRDCRNGDAIPASGWMYDCWVKAACGFKEVRQFRELAAGNDVRHRVCAVVSQLELDDVIGKSGYGQCQHHAECEENAQGLFHFLYILS